MDDEATRPAVNYEMRTAARVLRFAAGPADEKDAQPTLRWSNQEWNSLVDILRLTNDDSPRAQLERLLPLLLLEARDIDSDSSGSKKKKNDDDNDDSSTLLFANPSVNWLPPSPRYWNLLAHAILRSMTNIRSNDNVHHADDDDDNDRLLIVRELLRQGADPWQQSGYLKWTAWELAVWHNHVACVQLLCEFFLGGNEEDQSDKSINTLNNIDTFGSSAEETKKKKNSALSNALHLALELGYWDIAKLLLPFDTTDQLEGNALHWTLREANRLFEAASGYKNSETEHYDDTDNDGNDGADDDDEEKPRRQEYRPYHHYTQRVIPFLLRHGLYTDDDSLKSSVSLFHLVGPFVSVARKLCEAGFDDWQIAIDDKGRNVLHTSVQFPTTLQFFLQRATWDVRQRLVQQKDAKMITTTTTTMKNRGESPLAMACRLGARQSVQYLLGNGACVRSVLVDEENVAVNSNLDVLYLLTQEMAGQDSVFVESSQKR